MIEINLLPGAQRKRRSSFRMPVALPKLENLPEFDGWVAFILAAWVVAPAIGGWLFLDVRAQKEELTVAIEEARQDSIRFARIIEANERLTARRDTIAQKLEIIQEVDAGRYIWAHVMDEVSGALPEYTWLSGLQQVQGGAQPVFQIRGYTGNTFALTRFMEQLETSPFIRAVQLTSSERNEVEGRRMFAFILEASYEEPPADMIETVPLFAAED